MHDRASLFLQQYRQVASWMRDKGLMIDTSGVGLLTSDINNHINKHFFTKFAKASF